MPRLDAEEYLDRCGLTAYLSDALTLMLENQPAAPIAFLAQYFRQVNKPCTPLERAYRCIQLADPETEAFVDNLVAAFHMLESQHSARGITGKELVRLLRSLCADCFLDVSQSILVLLSKTEADVVGLSDFISAVSLVHFRL